jgi:hypothetical protein
MFSIILIAATAILCGKGSTVRNVPVAVGVIVPVFAGFYGVRFGGHMGAVVACGAMLFVMMILPVRKGLEMDEQGNPLAGGETTCPFCGRVLSVTARVCPRCMNELARPSRSSSDAPPVLNRQDNLDRQENPYSDR